MPTLARDRDKQEIIRRLRTLRPDSVRVWGRMTVHQMVCHVSDAFRMASGDKPTRDISSLGRRTLVKWIALHLPLRWPHSNCPRSRSDRRRHDPGRVLRRSRGAGNTRRALRGQPRELAYAPDLRTPVRIRVAALGLPAHRSPPAAVWCVGGMGSGLESTPFSRPDTLTRSVIAAP
jgi:hypothetical protein